MDLAACPRDGLAVDAGLAALALRDPRAHRDALGRANDRHVATRELGRFFGMVAHRDRLDTGRPAARRRTSTSTHDTIAINTFVRSPDGSNTLVVWPTNTDDLADTLANLGGRLGGEALLGLGDPIHRFSGPSHDQFVDIAERTIGALNEGATLATLGISSERALELIEPAMTIGKYLAVIRRELVTNNSFVRGLLKVENYRLWVLVIAGNDVEGDVGSLTRGGHAYVDIDRLMTATGANIVKELKAHPDRLGILGTVLDAKIMRLDVFAALAIMRQYASAELREKMLDRNLSTKRDTSAKERVTSSELGVILSGASLGTRKRGMKPRSNTKAAFEGLTSIATSDDGLLNAAIGEALKDAGLIESFEVEKDLGTDLKFTSDLFVIRKGEPIRIEVMWRTSTSRATIANYVLGKLGNYAKAIGLLDL